MSIKNNLLGGTDWTDGIILTAADLNDTFDATPILREIYTGSGFDTSSTVDQTDTEDHELTAVTDATGKYVKITFQGVISTGGSNDNDDYVATSLKAQIKEIGGAYSDIEAYQEVGRVYTNYSKLNVFVHYTTIHELTNGELTNGFQIKVFASSVNHSADTFTFTNHNVIVETLS